MNTKKEKVPYVIIYTDGACSGNPGPGGWAALLICNGAKKELSGHEQYTTNNRMELMATIKALEALNRSCEVTIYTDSAYLVNAHNQGWIEKWMEEGWVHGKKKSDVLNSDLWLRLLKAEEGHKVEFCKVPAHSGETYNEIVDRIAVEQSKIAAKK